MIQNIYLIFHLYKIQGEIPSDFNGNIKTEILIKNILTKLNCFLEDSELEKITNCLPNLPHAVHYINKNTRKIDVYSLFPLTKEISLKGKNEVVNYNENELQKILNSEKLELSNFIETKQQDYAVISDFENKFFSLVHDFAFYSRQHTESIGKLNEESIRDLLLIPIKMVISSHAEGEVFNYDGKSDLKIINPDNKYEYIIGELKWWNSQNSIEELCKQSFEKHVTGQEKTIYLLMLNKNKDISSPLNKCIEYINSLAFTSLKLEQKIISGSKEKFYVGEVTIRNENIPIIFGMFDLYHNKV